MNTMTIYPIQQGSRVEFDSEHGPQKGTVLGVTCDVGNGEPFAVIEIDHAMAGMLWKVPLQQLQPARA